MTTISLSSALQKKLNKINALDDNKITAEEAKKAGITKEELAEIKAAGIDTNVVIEDETTTTFVANKEVNSTNSGVKFNEKKGTYTVKVEKYKSGKVQDDGSGGKRYPNGSYWGIVTNAYPNIQEADKEKVYEYIYKMNGGEKTLQPGDTLKLPVLKFDKKGKVVGYEEKVSEKKTTGNLVYGESQEFANTEELQIRNTLNELKSTLSQLKVAVSAKNIIKSANLMLTLEKTLASAILKSVKDNSQKQEIELVKAAMKEISETLAKERAKTEHTRETTQTEETKPVENTEETKETTQTEETKPVENTKNTEETKKPTATANAGEPADVKIPDERIDTAATEQLKAEITRIKEEYNAAKLEAKELADKIDKKEDEYEALQEQLKGAIGKVEDAALNASEEVCIQVNKIRQQAQAEGWPESKLKQKLGAIGIPSISGEQRNLEAIGCDISALAKTITDLSNLYAAQANTVDMLAEQWGGFLEVDLNTVYVDLNGTVVVNEAGTGGPEVSGADGVSTKDMQKFASMTNAELTEYMSSDAGKELLTAMQGMANEGVNLSAENCAAILKTIIGDQDKSTGDIKKFGTQYADNIQVNEVNGVGKDELEEAIKKIKKKEEVKKSCDPYIINIDGVEYTMILDNKDGKWDTNDILGINDSKENLFEALKGLESDGDASTLTGAELQKAGIRLVAKNPDGKLAVDDTSKDFDLSKVKSIDMTNLKESKDNDGNVGTFGHFDLTLQDGRTIKGSETFEEKSTLDKLFGAVKEFFTNLGNIASDIIDKLKIDKDEKEWYSEGIKAKVAMTTKNTDTAIDDMIKSSDEVLDVTYRRTGNAADDYQAPKEEEAQQQQQPNDVNQLSEEEKRKLAEQQRK